ncbi:MAG TPA: cytochrome bd-I ubiquinol oxidase subunit CydA [Sutterella sp.]|nr:cytochrome bd-I ubiquinol oxidase subunit CydA [Sutterella sp.]
MFSSALVDLSRLQFALTSMYHFIFVPLTLGLSFLLVVMEACYLTTGKEVYKDMTRFWGKLFGINFALGVATGITMEFQFGTNWAYYSHYVGDIFGSPLAVEGLMAFFMESTFIGLFFFGWKRLSKAGHFAVTFLMALGSNLSALWILVANGWMQYPVGSAFNYETMRMEMTSFWEVVSSPWAQAKFMHTVNAGYMTGAVFVLAISSWYLIKNRDILFAKRSALIAAVFGLLATVFTLHLGDESGYLVTQNQPTKIAAMEAMWETEPAPASLSLLALPNEKERKNDFAIEIPWLFGLMGTHSISQEIKGINPLVLQNEERIRNGIVAVTTLEALRKDRTNEALREKFESVQHDLGYGLLLKQYTNDVAKATPEMVRQAALSTVPTVWPMYWSFRGMVGVGMICILLFALAAFYSIKGTFVDKPLLQKLCLMALPLPWIACELGWFVAEYGRQPWTIYEVLPTHLSVSALSSWEVLGSLIGFVLLYSALMAVEVWLMVRYAKLGPGSLGTGKYFSDKH